MCAGVCVFVEAISGTKITGPNPTLVAGNSTASLKCSATAGTMVTQAWMKDGKPLLSSNRVNVSGDSSQVTISPVQKEDSGEYKCQMTNAVSKEEATHKMVVYCEYDITSCLTSQLSGSWKHYSDHLHDGHLYMFVHTCACMYM